MRLYYEWPCKFCDFVGLSRRKLTQHYKENHKNMHKQFTYKNRTVIVNIVIKLLNF